MLRCVYAGGSTESQAARLNLHLTKISLLLGAAAYAFCSAKQTLITLYRIFMLLPKLFTISTV